MTLPALHVDFETRSTVGLKKAGAYVYAEHPTTDVWCMAYAFGNGPVEIWRMGEPMPEAVADHISAGGIMYAHNAAFERAIWHHIMTGRYGWIEPTVDQWRCTMSYGYAMALPGKLEHMAAALGSAAQKDMAGHRLMLAMSRPRKRRKGEPEKDSNGQAIIYWRDKPEDVARLHDYCKSDVEAERTSDKRLVRLRPFEQRLWHLDQDINDRGVHVDVELARRMQAIVEHQQAALDAEMARVTDYAVSAGTNVIQLKEFLKARGVELGEKLNKKTMAYVDTLDKEAIVQILARPDVPDACRRALELRQEASKASVTKVDALLRGMSPDGRARGLMQYHAANTGRWGGRRFQPQNLKRPPEDFDCDGAIDVILRYDTATAVAALDSMFAAPLDALSYILRGLIKAPPGKKIVAADFTSIEGVVLPWLAGEQFKLDAFRRYIAGKGPDMYIVAASGIYGIPVEQMSKKTHPAERQIGKVAELACGYGGGVGAFQVMAHGYGVKVSDTKADEIKTAWREAHTNVVKFWKALENAALDAIAYPGKVFAAGDIKYRVVGSFLWCQLPSGRALCYPYPAIRPVMTPWGEWKDAVTFKTQPNQSNFRKIVDDGTNTSVWARISTYGGGLAENVTQAASRDLLAEAMFRLEDAGYPIILHVHDENVSEVDEDFGSVDEYEEIMSELPPWAKGLPVACSGFEGERYKKA